MRKDATGGLTFQGQQAVGSDVGQGIDLVGLDRNQLSGAAASRAAVTGNIDRIAVVKGRLEIRQPRPEFAGVTFCRPGVHAPTVGGWKITA